MPLDFPANPTNGQSYSGYTYNSTTGAWLANSAAVSPVTMSDSVPPNPTSGDMWFNTSDATMYLYYNDGSSSQWVEARAPITSDGYYSPNYIINGGFDIWQRGTSFTSTAYGADRWFHPITNATVSQETSDLPAGFQYGIKFVTTAANGFAQFNQPLETANVIPLRGKTVTISGWIKISGSYTGNWISQALFSTSSDAYGSQGTLVPGSNKNVANSSTTSWTRFSNTFTVPSNAVGMRIENIPDSVQPSGVTVRMAGIQLEEGSVATPFRRNANSLQGELAACQRYYYRTKSTGWDALATGTQSGDYPVFFVQFPVEMRVAPSGSAPEQSAYSTFTIQRGGVHTALTQSIGLDYAGTRGARIATYIAGSGTLNGYAIILLANTNVAYLGFSAEL